MSWFAAEEAREVAVTFACNSVLLWALVIVFLSGVCHTATQAEDLSGGDFALNPTVSVPKLPTLPALDSHGSIPDEHELHLVPKHSDTLGHCFLGLFVVVVFISHQNSGVLPFKGVGMLEPVWAAAECGIDKHGVATQFLFQGFWFPDDSVVIPEEGPSDLHPGPSPRGDKIAPLEWATEPILEGGDVCKQEVAH